jgi:hypothetical protein
VAAVCCIAIRNAGLVTWACADTATSNIMGKSFFMDVKKAEVVGNDQCKDAKNNFKIQ